MRLIDADALKEVFQNEYKVSFAEAINEVIDEQPTIEERKTGKWRNNKISNNIYQIYCSVCKNTVLSKSNFCSNCGATMNEGSEKG